jgi:hypothetical protein
MKAIRKRSLLKLGALPPDPRDFPRSCHPRLPNQNRRGGFHRHRPGLAPESALRLHPCRALSSAPVSISVEGQKRYGKRVIVAGREE